MEGSCLQLLGVASNAPPKGLGEKIGLNRKEAGFGFLPRFSHILNRFWLRRSKIEDEFD